MDLRPIWSGESLYSTVMLLLVSDVGSEEAGWRLTISDLLKHIPDYAIGCLMASLSASHVTRQLTVMDGKIIGETR